METLHSNNVYIHCNIREDHPDRGKQSKESYLEKMDTPFSRKIVSNNKTTLKLISTINPHNYTYRASLTPVWRHINSSRINYRPKRQY